MIPDEKRGTKARKQKGGSPLSWNWFLFGSLLHSLGVSPLFFKKRLGKGDDGDLYDKIDDVDVENDGIWYIGPEILSKLFVETW